MIALFTIAFSCEQLLSFWKKVAKENQDKWAQKMFPFLKGFLARCQNVSLSISYFVFMFCFIFFMTQLGQKMRSTFSFYFVMTDISWNKYLPIRDNYYFIVSIWNRVTTVCFYHLLKIGRVLKFPLDGVYYQNHLNFRAKNSNRNQHHFRRENSKYSHENSKKSDDF